MIRRKVSVHGPLEDIEAVHPLIPFVHLPDTRHAVGIVQPEDLMGDAPRTAGSVQSEHGDGPLLPTARGQQAQATFRARQLLEHPRDGQRPVVVTPQVHQARIILR